MSLWTIAFESRRNFAASRGVANPAEPLRASIVAVLLRGVSVSNMIPKLHRRQRALNLLSLDYLCMKSLNETSIDELRDLNARLPGFTPAQGWFAPSHVTLITGWRLANGQEREPESLIKFVMPAGWPEPTDAKRIKSRTDVLDEFLHLNSATDTEVLSFAGRHGPLFAFSEPQNSYTHSYTDSNEQRGFLEKCDVWRYVASSMSALLRIAAGFHSGRSSSSDWEVIGSYPRSVSENKVVGSPEWWWSVQAGCLGQAANRTPETWMSLMNLLMDVGKVRPWIVWQKPRKVTRPQLVFAGPTLLSHLVLQLCLAATRQDAFAVCSYCNKQYSPLKRAPKAGQKNFCPECRASGVPVKIGQRSRAERFRNKKS